jgi:mRNA interferase MazF
MAGRDLKRGDVRWYRFASPDKHRPVLVLGRDSLLQSVSEVPVIPFSTQVRGLPWEVVLRPDEGLGQPCTLKPEWIRSVAARDLGPWICTFPAARWREVQAALISALGLDIQIEP